MAKQGWMSVRDLPGTKNKSIKEVLDQFKDRYNVCESCNGIGHTVNEYDSFYEGVSTIRFSDHSGLEEMREDGTLSKEVLHRIIETVVHGREQCDECEGFGFVSKRIKSRKKQNAKAS